MNLDDPQTFNEKLNWCKLNYSTELMKLAVDKIDVKDYVKSKGLEHIVTSTIKIYKTIDDLNFDDLPNQFVVKNSLDSGGVFICHDKSNISKQDIIDKLQLVKNEFINGKHWALEDIYRGRQPNRVLVEELIKRENDKMPIDYKFFCFKGEPKFLYVGSNREISLCVDYFDIDFNHMNLSIPPHKCSKMKIEKPKNYDEMIKIAKILSRDFVFVRVDLYSDGDSIRFGELTFYPHAALGKHKPFSYDLEFGKYFDIEVIKNEI